MVEFQAGGKVMGGAIGVPGEADVVGKTVIKLSSVPLRYMMM